MDARSAMSWFSLGLAAGFLACAANSFAFGGVFGFAYLSVGGLSAGASFVLAMVNQRGRRNASAPPA